MDKNVNEKDALREDLDVAELNRGIESFLGGGGPAGGASAGEDSGARSAVLHQKEITYASAEALRRRRRRRRVTVFLLVICLIAGAVIGVPYSLRESGRKSLMEHANTEGIRAPETAEIKADGRVVIYDGHYYLRNEDVVSIVCLGVDRDESREEMAQQLVAGEQGQADTIFVAALDTSTGKFTLINISRDSMIDVDLYNVEGGYAGVEEMQICLAYAYGDGAHKSCENTEKSVSRLLYGMPMDAYVSIGIPAISVLNDAVGGVTVTVLEDLSSRDPALVKGASVTLNGDQARTYVRSRDYVSTEANNTRMQRQRQYLTAFIRKVFASARRNISVILSLYQAAQTYMTTNLNIPRVVYLASLAMTTDFSERSIITVPGTAEMGETNVEFRVDEEALYRIILDVYYRETDEYGRLLDEPEAQTEAGLSGAEEIRTPAQTGTEAENASGSPAEPGQTGAEVTPAGAQGLPGGQTAAGGDAPGEEGNQDEVSVDAHVLH